MKEKQSKIIGDVLKQELTLREPELDVPFTYKIGAWPYQNDLTVEGLNCDILDSRLCQWNSASLIRICISGRMRNWPERKPCVKAVHITETFLERTKEGYVGEITLLPIVGIEEQPKYLATWIPFTIHQELVLHSMGMGKNTFVITCGTLQQQIEVIQGKVLSEAENERIVAAMYSAIQAAEHHNPSPSSSYDQDE
jgi:hypothetical protein